MNRAFLFEWWGPQAAHSRLPRGGGLTYLGKILIKPPMKCFRYVLRLMKRKGSVTRLHLTQVKARQSKARQASATTGVPEARQDQNGAGFASGLDHGAHEVPSGST